MNIKPAVIFLSFLFISLSGFSQYHYIQKLGDIATVVMPDKPKMVEIKGVKQYVLNQDGVIYMASAADVKAGLLNIFDDSSKDHIYDGFISGIIGNLKGKLLYRDKIIINGHPAIQFALSEIMKQQQVYGYYRCVIVNDTLITCGVMSSDLVAKNNGNLVAYFNGFKTVDAKQAEKISSKNAAFTFGKIVGGLLILALFVAFGFGIVFIIKRLAYRKS